MLPSCSLTLQRILAIILAATWYAEHQEESTLAFYATHSPSEILGPGVAAATYGGAIFFYPPRPFPTFGPMRHCSSAKRWRNDWFAAACLHAQARQVALASWLPPGMVGDGLQNALARRSFMFH